jgi:hypothetical protein
MNLRVHLQIAGALLLFLSAAHGGFSRYFGWKQELGRLSPLTRQMFLVHTFFIALVVALLGGLSLFCTDALLTPGPLSRAVLAGIFVFWLFRLAVQWFVYSPAIWRGRRFYTFMHCVFSAFWIYAVLAYGLALQSVWKG